MAVSLDGALGKIALRTRSAPRQLLQVQPSTEALGKSPDGENHPGALASALPTPHNVRPHPHHASADADYVRQSNERRPAMDRRQVLMALERLYSTVLDIEQMRRTQPVLPANPEEAPEDAPTQEDLQNWCVASSPQATFAERRLKLRATHRESQYAALKDKIWRQWRMPEPLDIRCVRSLVVETRSHPCLAVFRTRSSASYRPARARSFFRGRSDSSPKTKACRSSRYSSRPSRPSTPSKMRPCSTVLLTFA